MCLLVLGGCAGGDEADADPVWGAGFEAKSAITESVATQAAETALPPANIDCDLADDDMPTERLRRPEIFWASDPALRVVLGTVLARLTKATGLRLSVAEGGYQVIRVELPPGYAGHAGPLIQLDADFSGAQLEAVLLHEISHTLGAGHLGPWEGVMSRCTGNQSLLLTAADLEQICSAAPCATFLPEVPIEG